MGLGNLECVPPYIDIHVLWFNIIAALIPIAMYKMNAILELSNVNF